jgi:hypothetical protein
MVAVPGVDGVNTPVLLTAPILVGLTDQVTAVLKLPVPVTVGVQVAVRLVRIEVGEQLADTDVIVGVTGGVLPPPLPPPPPQPATHKEPRERKANKILHVIRVASKPDCL